MRPKVLKTVQLQSESDLVSVRQCARQISRRLGFDTQDEIRIAAATSELARNVIVHRGGGAAEFALDGAGDAMVLLIRTVDRGPAIPDPDALLHGQATAGHELMQGLRSARRLVGELGIRSDSSGNTTVDLRRPLPRRTVLRPDEITVLARELEGSRALDPTEEARQQQKELLASLEELRRRQEELEQLNRELEETNRGVVALHAELEDRAESLRRTSESKTRFFSQMSHEFRTPLNSIISLATLLLDRTDGALTPEQEKQVTYIRSGALTLTQLVNDLLDVSKVESGRATVQPNSFRLDELFGAIRGTLRPLASPSVTLQFRVEDDLPALHTDEGKLAQILRNLVANALKFTEEGEVRVVARRGRHAGWIEFSVTDTGIGIAPEDRERIFEDFVQIEGPLQRRTKGTGLGLPLSKRLVELLGGQLRVESTLGGGSTFRFQVPARHGEAEPAAAAPSPRSRVLIVEDEESFRYLLRRILRETPYACYEAADGMQAMDSIRADPPDLILLDLMLPGLDGFEIMRQLREGPELSKIPVIVMTSSILTDDDRKRLAGAVAVLSKGGLTRQKLLELLSFVRSGEDRNGIRNAHS